MQIKSLEIFTAVIKLQSFSAAAQHLHTVQSNVTAHIKKLEMELQAELLHRQHPIRPTRAGMQLFRAAEQMLKLHQEVLNQFNHSSLDSNLPLEIGSMETTAAIRLPALFQNLQKRDLQFPYTLTTAPTRELIDAVQAGQLDCAFIANPAPVAGLFNSHVWTEELVLISAKNSPNPLSAEYLSHKKFISFKQGCSYRKVIDHYLSIQQLPAANILEMGSLDGIVSCVSLDVGIAILPLKYVQQSYFYPHIQIHALDAPLARMPTYLIAGDQNQWSSNMHLFFKHLHTEQSPSLPALTAALET